MNAQQKLDLMDALANRDLGWKCFYCFQDIHLDVHKWEPNRAVLEHLVPKFHGGSDDPKNLVLACQKCNNRKAHRLIDDFLNPAAPIFPCWRSWAPIIERWEAALV